MTDFSINASPEIDDAALRSSLREVFSVIERGFREAESNAQSFFDQFERRSRRSASSAGGSDPLGFGRISDGARRAEREVRSAADAMNRATGSLEGNVASLGAQFRDLVARGRELGASSQVLDPLERSLRKLAAQQEILNQETRRYGSVTDETARGVRRQYELISRELSVQQGIVQAFADRRTNDLRTQNSRLLNETINSEQQRTNAIRAEGKIRAIEAQRQANLELASARASGQARNAVLRFSLESAGRLQKAYAELVSGTLRTATSGVSRISSATANGFRRVFTRSSREVELGGDRVEASLRQTFREQERIVETSSLRQVAQFERIRQRQQAGLLGVANRSTLVAGGVGVGGALLARSGFERASDLERLNLQFTALLGNAQEAQTLLDEVEQFALATPFDLVGVADLAKGFLTIGTAAEDVLDDVQAVTDAVAFTGGTTQELERVQRAMLQIVSAGRLQGDELNQLAENLSGLNIRQLLADQITDGSVSELGALQQAGELSADLVIDGLLTSFREDTRLQGATQAIAGTLAGLADNTKEAFSDVGAALVQQVAFVIRPSLESLQSVLQGVSSLIRGETTGALTVLRDLLAGVGVGVGGALGIRFAAESLALLGSAARLALTPMGLLVTAMGVLGGAFGVLLPRSRDLRDAVQNVRDAFGEGVARITGTAGDVGNALRSFGRDALEFIEGAVTPALVSVTNFVADEVIPRIATAVIFVRDTVFPAVVSGVRTAVVALRRFVQPALEALQQAGAFVAEQAIRAWGSIEPVVRSVGRRILGVASAVGSLIRGESSFSELARSVGSTLAAAVSVAGGVLSSIPDLASRALDAITDVLKARGPEVGLVLLGVLEEAAFQITNILTDPVLLAVIATAAVALGFTIAKGVARGLLNNIREAADLGLEYGGELVNGIVRSIPANLPKIAAALAALSAVPRLLAPFRSMGSRSASLFSEGLLSGITQGVRSIPQFLSGAVGGTAGIEGAIAAQTRAAEDALRRQGREINSILRAAGRDQVNFTRLNGDALKRQVEQGRAAADAIVEQAGAARVAGARYRNGLRDVRNAFSDFGSELRSVTRRSGAGAVEGFGEGLLRRNQLRLSFGLFRDRLRSGLSEVGRAIRSDAASIGRNAAAATAGALSGIAIGAGIGQADTFGGQAIGVAGLASASLAIGAINPVAGAATFALGGLAAAFTSADKAAANSKASIDGLTSSIVASGAGASESIDQIIGNNFIAKLNEESTETLSTFNTLLGQSEQSLEDFSRSVANGGADARAAVEDLLSPLREDLISDLGGLERYRELVDQISDAGANSGSAGPRALREALAALSSDESSDARERLASLTDLLDLLDDEIYNSAQAIERSNLTFGIQGIERVARDASPAVAGLVRGVVSAVRELDSAAINPESTTSVTAIQAVTKEAELLSGALGEAKTAFDRLVNPDALSIDSELASTLRTLSSSAGTLQGLPGSGTSDVAQQIIRTDELNGIRSSIASAFEAGARDGLSFADLNDLVAQPLRQLVRENFAFDPALVQQLIGDINRGLVGAERLQIDLDATTSAQLELDRLNEFLAANPAIGELRFSNLDDQNVLASIADRNPTLIVDLAAVDGEERQAQVNAALEAYRRGLDGETLVVSPDLEGAALIQEAYEMGLDLGRGLERGIDDSRRRAEAAAARLARGVTARTREDFGIRSPSRVFIELGQQTGEGFAVGLTESLEDVETRLGEAVDRIIEGARERVANAGRNNVLGGALSELLDGLVNTTARNDLRGYADVESRLGILGGIEQLREEITRQREEEIAGAGSLGLGTVAGLENRQSVIGIITSLQSFISTSLASGRGLDETLEEASGLRDLIVEQLAGIFGGNVTAIERMIEALGLSEEALTNFANTAAGLESEAAPPPPQRNVLPVIGQQSVSGGFVGERTINIFPQRADVSEIVTLVNARAVGRVQYEL